MQRISHRGRTYEASIDSNYLLQLNTLYENWINNWILCPVLTVPADRLDYVAKPEHLDQVVTHVQAKLAGKEEVHFDD
jgi:deoxyadenosine/deoxycytidine kinase